MGLDDFTSGGTNSSGGSGGGASQKKKRKTRQSTSSRWVTKLDFSAPYVVVARDYQGNIYKHQDQLAVLEDADDWRRLDEHPNEDLEVLVKFPSKEGWLRFCNLCQDQHGVNPSEVLEDNPKRLMELKEKTHYPPGSKPDGSRTCQVCEATSDDDDTTMLELRMEKHRRLAVCSSHTVEELAAEGLLQ
jgi:hypothetical protein